jgi:hypothetical protein
MAKKKKVAEVKKTEPIDEDKKISGAFAQKSRDVIIKFKRMEDIISENAAWFDGYGNLHVAKPYGHPPGSDHLSPSYFHYLGKTKTCKSHHSFPDWCIENEWDDLFAPNMALRVIASGKLTPEDAVALAKKSVLIP